jgi:hypothetical protein
MPSPMHTSCSMDLDGMGRLIGIAFYAGVLFSGGEIGGAWRIMLGVRRAPEMFCV